MKIHRLPFLGFVVCAACGGPKQEAESAQPLEPPSEPESEAPTPVDVQKMLERESTGLKDVIVEGPREAWTAKAPAAAAPRIGETNGISVVEIPLGGDGNIRCQVFANEVDPAGTIAQFITGAASKVKFKRVVPTAVRVLNETPVAFMEALYNTDVEGGSALGHLKLAMYPASPKAVLCLHDEVGYSKTFENVATRFCESLVVRGKAPPKASFVEVQIAALNGVPVGFSKTTLTDSGGVREIRNMSATFIPTSESALNLADMYSIEKVDKNDRLVEETYAQAAGGQLAMQVTLKRDKDAVYRYEGTVQGKNIKGEIRAPDKKGLPSSIADAKELASKKRKSKGFSLVQQRYNPEANPEKLTPVKLFRDAAEPENAIHYESGEMKAVGRMDDEGLLESLDMPAGAATLNFRREFIRGKFAK